MFLLLTNICAIAQPQEINKSFNIYYKGGKVLPTKLIKIPSTSEVSINSLDKITVIHFWATWCAPCVQELPELINILPEFKKYDVQTYIISTDTAGATKVPAFLKQNKIEITDIYLDPKSTYFKKLSGNTLPTTILIDRNGNEIGRINGATKWTKNSVANLLSKTTHP